MTDPPPMRKSASKSPPMLPAHLTLPRPPPSSTSQDHPRNSSTSDIGVLKLSGQVSQNDDRLPPTTTTEGQASLGSESESSPSGPLDPNISQLPFLDISPAVPANTLTLDSSQNQPTQTQEAIHHRQRAFAYVADSQSVDALSFPDMSTHPGPAVLGETSFSHNSDNSMNISLDRSTLSINSGSSGSHRSGSLAGHSSSNSRSSGSQAESQSYSDISFTNVETSTPRLTPNQQISQLSTPSDGEHHLFSLPLSPTSRYSILQQSPDSHGRGGGSAGGSIDHPVRSAIGLPGPSPPLSGRKVARVLDRTEELEEEEEISLGQRLLDDMPTQILELFDSDLKEDPADKEGSSAHPVQVDDDDDGDEVGNDEIDLAALEELNSQAIQEAARSAPPASRLFETKTTTTKTTRTPSTIVASTSSTSSSRIIAMATGRQLQEKEDEVYDDLDLNDYYTSDEDDDTNRSNTTTGVGINLQLSQSEANIEETLLPRSRQASMAIPQLPVPSSSASAPPSTAMTTTTTTSVNKIGVQTATVETQTDQITDLAHDVPKSRTRTPTTPTRLGSATSLGDSPTERSKRTLKGTRRLSGSPGSRELTSSSQSDAHSPSSAPSSFIQRLARAQQEDDNTSDEDQGGPIRPIISKRRRVGAEASTKARVPSSVEDEAQKQFWLGIGNAESATSGKSTINKNQQEGDDSEDEERRHRKSRSRSGSLDISSFPDEGLSELDIGPFTDGSQQTGGEEGGETEGLESTRHGPSTPPHISLDPSPTSRKSRRRAGSPPQEPPRVSPKRVPSRQLRRSTSAINLARGTQPSQTSSQTSSSAPARVSLRRMQSTVDASRVYKTDDPVWARWRKSFYAGKVVRKNNQLYDIHFLDDDVATCENTQMRPFKLKLGANVMGKKTESMDYEAAVEGIKMSNVFALSRVDVRFEDDTEANLSLNQISLTTEMMAQLDKEVNWDSDDSTAAGSSTGPGAKSARAGKRASTSQARRETSFFESLTGPSYSQSSDLFSTQQTDSRAGSPIPTTPPKGKNSRLKASQKSFAAPSTPTRRSKGSGQSLGLSTPARRTKDLFKDARFVLSLTGPGGSTDLVREMSSKIKTGGGTVIEDYTSLMDPAQRASLANVFLISTTSSRTVKYISALALSIPRLSYRWVDACIEARQLLPHQSYHLPTGYSNELETIVSSSPCYPNGLFHGLTIGLCGGLSIRNSWERNLLAAGAKETKMVNEKTGPMNCNYIVFFSLKAHKSFIESNKKVPSLCDEWLVQCLINQRIVSIHGHPSYTDLEKKGNPPQQQRQQPLQQRPHLNSQHAS